MKGHEPCARRRRLACLLAGALSLVPDARADLQRLPVPVDSAPAAAANARGDAVVAWRARSGAMHIAFAPRGGRFGRPRSVPGSRLGPIYVPPRVAIDARGNAVVAWEPEGSAGLGEECCYRVYAFVRHRSGRLTRVRRVSGGGDTSADLRGVAAGGGRFAVLWWDFDDTGEDIRAAVAGRQGVFAGRVRLSADLGDLIRRGRPRRSPRPVWGNV